MRVCTEAIMATLLVGVPQWALATQATQPQKGGDLNTLLWWLVFFGFLVVLVAGMGNRIVIFYDTADLMLTFSPWIAIVVFGVMLGTLEEGMLQTIVRWIAWISIVGLTLAVIANSVRYNKSLLIGLIVGPFKLLFAVVGILAVLNLLDKGFSKDSSFKDFTVAGIVFGITGWVAKKLINGEQVYLRKGWELPQTQQAETA